MVMNWRHLKDTFLAQFVRADLENYGQRLDYKNAANKRKKQFLLDHHRHRAYRASQSQRAHVAHKNFRGMSVIPKKSDGCTHHGSAKNCELAHLRHTR